MKKKKAPNGYCVGPLMRKSTDGPGLPGVDAGSGCWWMLVASRGLAWCSSDWCSFLVALSSFVTLERLLRRDGAWVNANQEMSYPTGWLSEPLSHMHY